MYIENIFNYAFIHFNSYIHLRVEPIYYLWYFEFSIFRCINKNVMNTNIRPHVYESCFVRMCYCSLLCFSFGFYLRFVLVSKNVDVVIQNMTFRPKGFAAVKPTNYIVCMSDCAYVSTCAHSLIHSCNNIRTLLCSYALNVQFFN